jgi:hypothetical protein
LFDLEALYREYATRIDNIISGSALGGGWDPQFPTLPDGTTDPGGTTPPGGTTQPLLPGQPHPSVFAGGPCSVGANTGYKGMDGEWYFCVNGRWTHRDDVFGPATRDTGMATTTTTTNGGMMPGINGTTQNGSVSATLRVTGDKTLERILAELQYDVIVDLLS